jgi:hypothetical protein
LRSEVEQLELTIRAHENVRRLEVAVDHKVLVRVLHGLTDVDEQLEALLDGEVTGVAVRVDRLTLDELHREVRQPVSGQSSVDEMRDAWMLEQRQDAPFLDKASQYCLTRPDVPHELECHALLEFCALSFGEIHDAHAAGAELAEDAEWADALRSRRRCGWVHEQHRRQLDGRRLQEVV